jgi:hypothetical protein
LLESIEEGDFGGLSSGLAAEDADADAVDIAGGFSGESLDLWEGDFAVDGFGEWGELVSVGAFVDEECEYGAGGADGWGGWGWDIGLIGWFDVEFERAGCGFGIGIGCCGAGGCRGRGRGLVGADVIVVRGAGYAGAEAAEQEEESGEDEECPEGESGAGCESGGAEELAEP